jgi:hypothetical protein
MRYEPSPYTDISTFDRYLKALSSPIDSFLEDHILDSCFFRIVDGVEEAGHFAIHRDVLLTQFYLEPSSRAQAQNVFSDILARHSVKSAFVPTCDEFFLSHALDAPGELKKQAYFFAAGGKVQRPPIMAELQYRPASGEDAAAIIATSGKFLSTPEKDVSRGIIHVGFLRGEMVAVGVDQMSRILPHHASIGMFTREAERRKGIGTSTILYLKERCLAAGKVPVAGCWYYNHNSKRTLQAAGMVTATRLLRFEFEQAKTAIAGGAS